LRKTDCVQLDIPDAPGVPLSAAVLVISGAWFSVSVKFCGVIPAALLAEITSVCVPPLAAPLVVAAGVPEITPVDELRLRPAGKLPFVIA
jgi:hypothetical protein